MKKNNTGNQAVKKNVFAEMEEEVQSFWEKSKTFEKSVNKKAPNGDYVFYDGPPFATGLPHYGHIVASVMKDAVPRYWTMKGFKVERRWGWDCHGLPVENLAEKELGLKDKTDIEKIGVEKFNEYCESIVMRYANDWKGIIHRMGRWVDMENDYKTMDPEFMESVWWVFKSLYEKDLIYKDYKSMHICPRCGTTLSNFEVGLGYKNIKDLSVVAEFNLLDEERTSILAWTTTPWTLIGNVALAVGSDIDYVKVEKKDEGEGGMVRFILAKDKVEKYFEGQEFEIVSEIKGSDLIGKKYKPLFDYYSKDEELKNKENGWQVYSADFVTTEDGTGIVHIAPAFGEDDMALGKEHNLPWVQHVDSDGRFKDEVILAPGAEVKPKDNHMATDIEIIKHLAHNDLLFHKEKYEHSYPHCWRCESPLLNYATESWFVSVTKIKENLIANNQKVSWVPEHVKDGRFGKWLDGARDWAISRNRYWGSCMPVWECDKCDHTEVIGSIEELKNKSGKEVDNLHKQFVDEISWKCSDCDGEMKRIPEVLDCWFESGSMPYAQHNYLGKAKENFDPENNKNFPAQFIAEGMDQTRGWFYTLMVLSSSLYKEEAFKNVIVNGIVLAEDGHKMSKSKQNYPDPSILFDKFGVDALRYYLLASPVLNGENLNFSEDGVKEVLRKTVMILWNVVKFYGLFAEQKIYIGERPDSNNVLDQWILARLDQLTKEVTDNMDRYEIPKAVRPIVKFIDDLSTWYIRRSRDRFKGENESDKQKAIETTGYVLTELAKLMAPFTPFIAERVWQTVTGNDFKNENKSVHLEKWTVGEKNEEEKLKIIEEMEAVRRTAKLGQAARDLAGIKVRQPLSILHIDISGFNYENEEYYNLLRSEINVQKVEIISDNYEWPTKRERKIVKITDYPYEGTYAMEKDAADFVALKIDLTPELKAEGVKRELVRFINSLRKKAGLSINDKVKVYFEANDEVKKVITEYKESIMKETLATDLVEGVDAEIKNRKEVKINGEEVVLGI